MKRFLLLTLFLSALHPPSAFGQDETIGVFTYSPQIDDFTDEDRSMVFTADQDEEGILAWRCLADGLNVIIHVGGYMGGDRDDDIQVRYRFDRNKPSAYQYWRLFPGQNKLAYMRMRDVEGFTQEGLLANELVIEAIDPLDGERRRFRMSMIGLTRALKKLPCAQPFH